MQYVIAHDLGTSGDKALLFTLQGEMVTSVTKHYGVNAFGNGCVEQNPEDWWKAVCGGTKDLICKANVTADSIAGVSFSGQMMGCVLVDRNADPLRPALIWADTRASEQEAYMKQRCDTETFYHLTGHRAGASYTAAKLLWVRDHETENVKRAWKCLNAKDFIIFRLTGKCVTDFSDACGTNLFDINTKTWSQELLTAFDVPEGLLPEAFSSVTVAGGVTPKAAELCGLKAGTPVVIGAGDGVCATVGAGITEPGEMYNVLGSSSWISTVTEDPLFDAEMRTFNFIMPDGKRYSPMGTMQAAGTSTDWFAKTFYTDANPFDAMNAEAAAVSAGANGVMYLPFPLGERSPWWNLNARGTFIGTDLSTARATMAKAVYEGVALNLKFILDIFTRVHRPESITIIGGGARNDSLLRCIADAWQMPLDLSAYPEMGTSIGAAVCACVGVGALKDMSEAKHFNPVVKRLTFDPGKAKLYADLQRIFEQAYRGLCPAYEALSTFRDCL